MCSGHDRWDVTAIPMKITVKDKKTGRVKVGYEGGASVVLELIRQLLEEAEADA